MLRSIAMTVLTLLMAGETAAADQPARRNEERSAASAAARALDLVVGVSEWLSHELGYPAVRELPRVLLVAPDELTEMFLGARGISEARHLPEIEALYSDKERTIFLPKGWSGRTEIEMSVLVHEMVHHIQNVNGMRYPCSEAREEAALAAQAAWLAQSGSDLHAAFGMDEMTIFVRTRCFY